MLLPIQVYSGLVLVLLWTSAVAFCSDTTTCSRSTKCALSLSSTGGRNTDISTSNNVNNHNMASTAAARRLVGKLKPETSALMVCDIQVNFRPRILATQQYTKVFGPTVPEVFANQEDLEACPIFEKKKFSMLTDEVQEHVDGLNKNSFLLVGIEAHVCLQQTALDLLEQGKEVHVIVDGVSSQQPLDREIALQRMAQSGAFLTTAQSAAFMLMQSANHENFKTVSKLTVEHMKLKNEFNEALLK